MKTNSPLRLRKKPRSSSRPKILKQLLWKLMPSSQQADNNSKTSSNERQKTSKVNDPKVGYNVSQICIKKHSRGAIQEGRLTKENMTKERKLIQCSKRHRRSGHWIGRSQNKLQHRHSVRRRRRLDYIESLQCQLEPSKWPKKPSQQSLATATAATQSEAATAVMSFIWEDRR
jgi:hypothetical protein